MKCKGCAKPNYYTSAKSFNKQKQASKLLDEGYRQADKDLFLILSRINWEVSND